MKRARKPRVERVEHGDTSRQTPTSTLKTEFATETERKREAKSVTVVWKVDYSLEIFTTHSRWSTKKRCCLSRVKKKNKRVFQLEIENPLIEKV